MVRVFVAQLTSRFDGGGGSRKKFWRAEFARERFHESPGIQGFTEEDDWRSIKQNLL